MKLWFIFLKNVYAELNSVYVIRIDARLSVFSDLAKVKNIPKVTLKLSSNLSVFELQSRLQEFEFFRKLCKSFCSTVLLILKQKIRISFVGCWSHIVWFDNLTYSLNVWDELKENGSVFCKLFVLSVISNSLCYFAEDGMVHIIKDGSFLITRTTEIVCMVKIHVGHSGSEFVWIGGKVKNLNCGW